MEIEDIPLENKLSNIQRLIEDKERVDHANNLDTRISSIRSLIIAIDLSLS